ncbi:MAG: hypothetical protein EVB11_13165 [Winogradskyella sp.]|nr:MAG: hypothetical protein EVB11_13165 [Winogradskyella sp.]
MVSFFTILQSCSKEELKNEKDFFNKYANLNGVARLTFTTQVLQAYNAYNSSSPENQIILSSFVEDGGSFSDNISISLLENNLSNYTDYVNDLIGIDELGNICLCPDGIHYCNWSSAMLETFIVDTDLWNLVSVEVFHLDGTLISNSIMDSIEHSSGSSYALVTMSNPNGIQSLVSGDEIIIVLKWMDGDELQYITLRNIID